jgi:hypothetical protein
MPKTMVGVRLETDVYDRLCQLGGPNRSITDLVKAAITQYLDNPKPPLPQAHCPNPQHQGKAIPNGWWCFTCAKLYR